MLAQTLIDRMARGDKLTIDEFISLMVDYRPMGSYREQINTLTQDLDSLGYQALGEDKNAGTMLFTPRRNAVDDAFYRYVEIINSGYQK